MTTAALEKPQPRVLRGTLLSLLIIPAGIALWTLVWSLGFVSAIVAFAIAVGAVYLFRLGAGGRVGRLGIVIISLVVLVTLVLAFIFGLVVDYARFISEEYNLPFGGLFSNALFWESFGVDLPAMLNANGLNILLAAVFAVLGTFGTLRSSLKAEAAADAAAAAPATGLEAPTADATVTPTADAPAPAASAPTTAAAIPEPTTDAAPDAPAR